LICELCRHDNPQENRFCGMCGTSLKTTVFKSKSEPAYTPQGDSSQSPAGGESTSSQRPNLPFETTAQSRPARKPPEPVRPFWERHPVTPVVDEEPTPPQFNAIAFEEPRRNASAPRSTAGSMLGAWVAETSEKPKAEPLLRSPSLRRSAARRLWDSALNLMPVPTTCSKMKKLAAPGSATLWRSC